jgi:hypothetical protein
MAVLHGIQDLEEGPLDEIIIADVLALLSDVRKQVTFWAILDDNVGAIWGIHDLDQGYYIGMSAGLMVELDLTLLELALTGLKTNLVECLHGIRNVCLDVHGCVDDTICSHSKNAGELKPSSENLS